MAVKQYEPVVFDRNQFIRQPVLIEKELRLLFPVASELVIFDIGACEAEDSVRYSLLFPEAEIFSFEALPQNVLLGKKYLNDYNIQNVHLINKALSNKEGNSDFFVSSGKPDDVPESDWDYGNKSSSLLYPDKAGEITGFLKFNEKINVETTTIDCFCSLA